MYMGLIDRGTERDSQTARQTERQREIIVLAKELMEIQRRMNRKSKAFQMEWVGNLSKILAVHTYLI